MMDTIYNILTRQSLRLSLLALVLTFGTVAYAQDDFDEESGDVFKAPKKKAVVDNNTLLADPEKMQTDLLDSKSGLNASLTANAWNYCDENKNLYMPRKMFL